MRITSVEQLTHEKWLNLFVAGFENRGHAGRWVFASRKAKPHQGVSSDAVLIVPVLRNPGEPARLVLIREFRVPVGDHVISLPAGLIEPGEPLEETVRRELHEETGLELVAVHRTTQPLIQSAGLSDESIALAFVEVRGVPSPNPEASEAIEVMVLDYPGLCALRDDRSVIIDSKAWLVLVMYGVMGKIE